MIFTTYDFKAEKWKPLEGAPSVSNEDEAMSYLQATFPKAVITCYPGFNELQGPCSFTIETKEGKLITSLCLLRGEA